MPSEATSPEEMNDELRQEYDLSNMQGAVRGKYAEPQEESGRSMAEALFRSVDCVMLAVDDLEAAIEFYRDRLGHKLVWRTDKAAGLAFGDGVTEIVLGKRDGNETDIKVASAVEAANRFEAAGGSIVAGPFDIAIGKCVVVQDPWGNQLVLLDTSKGLLKTDEDGFVIS